MEPALDVFHPMLRVLERYRRDVHQLAPPSSEDALTRAIAAIGQPVPLSLTRFLERWNGAALFRGALQIRSADELAPVSERVPSVIAFAEGPLPQDRWCFAPDGVGGAVFGRWLDEEQAFEPLHERFERWFAALVRILDENRREDEERLQAHIDADPSCGHLLLAQADAALYEGDASAARHLLRKATAAHPGLVVAWERLGDTLIGDDDSAARWAYLKALRAIRLPASYPTLPAVEPRLMRTLASMFPAGDDAWERELTWFIDEAVRDIGDHRELELFESAAIALCEVRVARGERVDALETLRAHIDRARSFHVRSPLFEASLLAGRLEVELGHHDEAERRLRVFRIAPPPLRARAQLLVGEIAVSRQEPWATEILGDALRAGLDDPADRARCEVLLGRRALFDEDPDRAESHLTQALSLANLAAEPQLVALAHLGLADLARQRGDLASAEAGYRLARGSAGDDPELLQRVLVRRGNLFEHAGEPSAALRDYLRAAEALAALQLPIREAWARLRGAALGAEGQAELARSRFQDADFAAGVAAVDAILDEPGRSLEWHLARTTDHARERANAQRARPPLSRADAERPERRIGAHRAAIAACNVGVVTELAAVMDGTSRTLAHTTPRLTDPNLTRYVAAADLLSGHRSYEAAEVLLRHLLEVRCPGHAGQALVGAMARSKNAAIVDGLLEALDGGFDPNGMAAAADVLGWRREKAAVETLRRLMAKDAHRTPRRAAITALGRIGDEEAIPDLLEALETPELAEATSIALLLLGEWTGVDHQGQALASREPGMGRSLGEIVGRYGGPAYLLLLLRTSELEGPAGLGALQGLGYLGDPRGIERLIEATAARDPHRVRVANGALELLTGHSESADESLLRNRWLEWWHQVGHELKSGRRYRHGQLMSPGMLVERMAHDDAMVRRSTYDELVISTGARLPFDADGPFRVQVAHQTAWRAWWQAHQTEFPAGGWWFHGEAIG